MIMKNIALYTFLTSAFHDVGVAMPTDQDGFLMKRLENGLGRTPALGYNNWVHTSSLQLRI